MKIFTVIIFALSFLYVASANTFAQSDTNEWFQAVRKADIEQLDFLLKHGADIDAKDTESMSALHHAVVDGNTKLVEYLIDHHADPNLLREKSSEEKQEMTPLMLSILKKHHDVTRDLIEHGADVNFQRPSDRATALHVAAYVGDIEIAQFLLKKGAYLNATIDNGATALAGAIYGRNTQMVRFLLEQGIEKENIAASSKMTPLMLAAATNNLQAVKLLIHFEANPDNSTEDGNAAQTAAGRNYIDIVKFLENPELNIFDEVELGIDILPELSKDNKLIKEKNAIGQTLLHWSIYLGKHSLVQQLIQAGADINAQDNAQRTPLFYAIFLWNSQAAKILIEYGADLNKPDINGESPLALAKRRSAEEIEKILEQKHAVFHPIQLKAEMVMPIGHRGEIKALDFSSDGKYFVSASEDHTAILWDVATRKKAHIFTGHTGAVLSVALSPDGKYLVSGSTDSTVKLWDVLTGTEIRTLSGHNFAVSSVSFSPDGQLVISGSHDDSIKLWDIFSGEIVQTFIGHADDVNSVCFSKDGKLLLSGSDDKTAKLWDAVTGKELLTLSGHSEQINVVNFSPDGKYAVSAGGAILNSKDNTIKVWEVATGTLLKTLTGHTGMITGVSCTPDSKYVISVSSDHTLREWEVDTGKEIKQINLLAMASALSLSADGKYALVGKLWLFQLWNLATEKETIPADVSSMGGVRGGACFISNDERKGLLLVSYPGGLNLWDLAQGKIINTLDKYSGRMNYITCLPGKQSVWVEKDVDPSELGKLDTRPYTDTQTSITQLDFTKSEPLVKKSTLLQGAKEKMSTSSLFFAPDGKTAIRTVGFAEFNLKAEKYITDQGLTLIDTETGETTRIFDVHPGTGMISDVSFSLDGKRALSVSSDNKLILWDIAAEGEEKQLAEKKQIKGSIEAYATVSFAPDSGYAVTGSPVGDVSVWDLEAGTEKVLSDRHGSMISVIRFSPDRKQMLTASYDSTLKIWDVSDISTPKVIHTFAGHTNWITTAAFSPDGKYVVSGAMDGTVKVWNSKQGIEVATLVSLSREQMGFANLMKKDGGEIQLTKTTDWLIITPDNYYTCSRNVQDIMSFKKGIQTFLFDQFDLQYNRPDIVLKNLAYAPCEDILSGYKAYRKRLEKMQIKEAMFRDDFHAPQLAVLNEDEIPLSTDRKTIKFNVKSWDTEEQLARLNVWVNGVPIYGIKGINLLGLSTKTDERALEIKLSQGMNTVQVAVQNTSGAESLKKTFEIKSEGKAVKADLYIVGIGVAEYSTIESLDYMDQDVLDLINLYKTQEGGMFKRVFVRELTNEQVTKSSVLKTKEFLQDSKVDDMAIVFFSGHGEIEGDENYLSTYDWDGKNPASTGFSYTELEGLLDAVPARKKLLLVNACHSGEYDDDMDTFMKMQEIFADLRRGSGATVISSSGSKESSWTGVKKKFGENSAFGYALLNALKGERGKNGKAADADGNFDITVSELKQYIDIEVHNITHEEQQPSLRQQNLEYDFPVMVVRMDAIEKERSKEKLR